MLIVPAEHDDIQVSVVVANVSLGPLGGRLSIGWLILNEICDSLHLCSGASRLHAFKVFQLRSLFDQRNFHDSSRSAGHLTDARRGDGKQNATAARQ
jgi:hypothetical protein